METQDPGQVIHGDWIQQQGFTQTENVVLRDKNLSVQARFLYTLLKMYAWQKGSAYPGQDTLAELMGVKVRMVQIYLKELIDKGLIERKQRGLNKSNLYIILPLGAKYCVTDPQHITGQKVQSVTGQEAQPITHEEYSAKNTQTKKTQRENTPALSQTQDDPTNTRTVNVTPDKQTGATIGGDLGGTLPDTVPAPAPRPAVHACEDKPVTVRLPEPDPEFDALTRQPGERLIPGKKGVRPLGVAHIPPGQRHPDYRATLDTLLSTHPARTDGAAKHNATRAGQALALIDPADWPRVLRADAAYRQRIDAHMRKDPTTKVMHLHTFLTAGEWEGWEPVATPVTPLPTTRRNPQLEELARRRAARQQQEAG